MLHLAARAPSTREEIGGAFAAHGIRLERWPERVALDLAARSERPSAILPAGRASASFAADLDVTLYWSALDKRVAFHPAGTGPLLEWQAYVPFYK